jgi:hypothetical protein
MHCHFRHSLVIWLVIFDRQFSDNTQKIHVFEMDGL